MDYETADDAFVGLAGRLIRRRIRPDRAIDDAGFDASLEQQSARLPSPLAVVERPVVHVHPDEGVGLGPVEAAGVLHRMIERRLSVFQSSTRCWREGGAKSSVISAGAEVLPDDVAAEGKGQSRLLNHHSPMSATRCSPRRRRSAALRG